MTSLGAVVVNDDVSPSNHIQVIQRGASRCRLTNILPLVPFFTETHDLVFVDPLTIFGHQLRSWVNQPESNTDVTPAILHFYIQYRQTGGQDNGPIA